MKVKLKRFLLFLVVSTFISGATLFGLRWNVDRTAGPLVKNVDTVQEAPVALVFGAFAYPNGTPSVVLEDRLLAGFELYQRGKVKKILLSGDHGSGDYDEVNSMKSYLEKKGVPAEDIFLDHAGFDTYDSLFRARDVFGAKSMILVTQSFHLRRALYIGTRLGLQVEGVPSDQRPIPEIRSLELRELAANVKAFADLTRARQPIFLGPQISLGGEGSQTHDKG